MKASHSFFDASISRELNRKANREHGRNYGIVERVSSEILKLAYWFSAKPEPRIWQKTNSLGETIWFVFDPETSSRQSFSSEKAVRMWLESRYSA